MSASNILIRQTPEDFVHERRNIGTREKIFTFSLFQTTGLSEIQLAYPAVGPVEWISHLDYEQPSSKVSK